MPKGVPKPAHMGTCFGCGHVDKWTPRFSAHIRECQAPLDMDLVLRTFGATGDGTCLLMDLPTKHVPKISYCGRSAVQVHVAVAEMLYGEQPDGMYLCHRCDDRRCISPDCLYYGTPSENSLDAWRNGKRVVTQAWIDATSAGRKASPKVRANAILNSKRNALRFRGDNHWTRKSPDEMKRWQGAIQAGRK